MRRCERLCVKAKQIVAVAEAVQQQPCGRDALRLAGKTSVSLSVLPLPIPSLAPAAPSIFARLHLGRRRSDRVKMSHFVNFLCLCSGKSEMFQQRCSIVTGRFFPTTDAALLFMAVGGKKYGKEGCVLNLNSK